MGSWKQWSGGKLCRCVAQKSKFWWQQDSIGDILTTFYRLSEDREGHFRFLDLPAELRNTIYDILLVIPGTTFPVTESLTTSKYRKRTVPESALNILCDTRQIHREAYAHFYSQNHLAFATPVFLQTFLLNLGHAKLDSLQDLTFFYDQQHNSYQWRDVLSPMDLILSMVRSMRGLRKLHIILRGPPKDHLTVREIRHLPNVHPPFIPGAKALFSLRNLTEFKIHNPFPAKHYRADGPEVARDLEQVDAAFKHFNHGLRLAQRGQVVFELYEDADWDCREYWPVVDSRMYACGSETGCSCAPDSDDDE